MLNLLVPLTITRPDASQPVVNSRPLLLVGSTMGTDWSVTCHAPGETSTDTIRLRLEEVFADIISQMSTWEPDSLISQFNRLPVGASIALPDAFRDVLDIAIEVAQATDGAFNPCLGTEVARRGFGSNNLLPSTTKIAQTEWRRLTLVGDRLTRHADIQIDLSAVAKGYTVDRMGQVLRELGICRFLAEIGGEFAAGSAKPDGLPWWVDLERTGSGNAWRVALCDQSLATSGDYRNMRVENGQRISHIVNHPDATLGAEDLASVSVLHASCATADAWATGLFASGGTVGLSIADQSGIAALFQFRNCAARPSKALQRMLD